MKQPVLFIIRSVKTRLAIFSLAIFALVVLALGSFFYFLGHMEQLLSLPLPEQVQQSVTSPETLRNLSRVFADTDFLLTTFVKREEFLKSENKRLQEQIEILRTGLPKSPLTASLGEFSRQAQIVLGLCAGINDSIRRIEKTDKRLMSRVQTLERLVWDKNMEMVLAGRDPSVMEQLTNIVAGYRETLLQIDLLFSKSGLSIFAEENRRYPAEIRTLIKELHLRLRTLGAAPGDIAALGRDISTDVQNLGSDIERFHSTLAELQKARADLSAIRGGSLQEMKKIDDNVALSSLGVQNRIQQIVDRARRYFQYFFAIALALTIGLTTAVAGSSLRNPLEAVHRAVESVRSGKFNIRLDLSGGSEWTELGKSINEMAQELEEARKDLEQRNRILEAGNARLQRQVECLEEQLAKAEEG